MNKLLIKWLHKNQALRQQNYGELAEEQWVNKLIVSLYPDPKEAWVDFLVALQFSEKKDELKNAAEKIVDKIITSADLSELREWEIYSGLGTQVRVFSDIIKEIANKLTLSENLGGDWFFNIKALAQLSDSKIRDGIIDLLTEQKVEQSNIEFWSIDWLNEDFLKSLHENINKQTIENSGTVGAFDKAWLIDKDQISIKEQEDWMGYVEKLTDFQIKTHKKNKIKHLMSAPRFFNKYKELINPEGFQNKSSPQSSVMKDNVSELFEKIMIDQKSAYEDFSKELGWSSFEKVRVLSKTWGTEDFKLWVYGTLYCKQVYQQLQKNTDQLISADIKRIKRNAFRQKKMDAMEEGKRFETAWGQQQFKSYVNKVLIKDIERFELIKNVNLKQIDEKLIVNWHLFLEQFKLNNEMIAGVFSNQQINLKEYLDTLERLVFDSQAHEIDIKHLLNLSKNKYVGVIKTIELFKNNSQFIFLKGNLPEENKGLRATDWITYGKKISEKIDEGREILVYLNQKDTSWLSDIELVNLSIGTNSKRLNIALKLNEGVLSMYERLMDNMIYWSKDFELSGLPSGGSSGEIEIVLRLLTQEVKENYKSLFETVSGDLRTSCESFKHGELSIVDFEQKLMKHQLDGLTVKEKFIKDLLNILPFQAAVPTEFIKREYLVNNKNKVLSEKVNQKSGLVGSLLKKMQTNLAEQREYLNILNVLQLPHWDIEKHNGYEEKAGEFAKKIAFTNYCQLLPTENMQEYVQESTAVKGKKEKELLDMSRVWATGIDGLNLIIAHKKDNGLQQQIDQYYQLLNTLEGLRGMSKESVKEKYGVQYKHQNNVDEVVGKIKEIKHTIDPIITMALGVLLAEEKNQFNKMPASIKKSYAYLNQYKTDLIELIKIEQSFTTNVVSQKRGANKNKYDSILQSLILQNFIPNTLSSVNGTKMRL